MHRTSTGDYANRLPELRHDFETQKALPAQHELLLSKPMFGGNRNCVRILAQTNLRLVLRFVHPGISRPHFIGDFKCCSNLNQRSGSDPRTVHGGGLPGGNILHQLRPEREQPALRRLGRMDPATGRVQKVALRVPRLPQPDEITRPVNVLGFKRVRRHTQKSSSLGDVGFAQVHVPVLPAACRTACLTSKSKPVHLYQDHTF